MGKSFAPPYACLTLGFLEETRLFPELFPSNFEERTTALIVDFFYRYIDDGFNFLPKTVSPEMFLGIMNSMHPAIQYTITLPVRHSADSSTNNFLSIKVIQSDEGDIKTDVFYKETNAHDYLQFDSHHPHHTKINIPYTLAKRIVLLTSEGEWVRRNLADLRDFLLCRGYPADVIDRGIHNAQLQGPAPQPQEAKKTIPLVTTYFSNLDSKNILQATKDLVGSSKDQRIRSAFENTKFIQAHRQPKNLLQLLSNSSFITSETPVNSTPRGIFKCGRNCCKICKFYLQECSSFVTSKGVTWNVKCHATCKSLNVLYFLSCNSCNNTTYIGKTDNFRNRTNDHISKCRSGVSTNKFDVHVYNCSLTHSPKEPFFKAYILMVLNDYNKLLNVERKLHLQGHDTMNCSHSSNG